jgi:hypothetical protein
VAEAASRPLLSDDQLSSSESVSFTLKPCFLKKTDSSEGSSPPLATTRPA